jgi:hypothetical protein
VRRVIDQDLDATPETVGHTPGGPLALIQIGYIAGDGNGRAPTRFNLAGDLGRPFTVDIKDRDSGPFSSEAQTDRPPDAVGPAAPGDDGHFALKAPRDASCSVVHTLHPTPIPVEN